MLQFPTARPTGPPPSESQDSACSIRSSPVKPSILPLHAHDKPLPPFPPDQSSRRTVASSSGEDTQRGLKGWWKRNRQRSKGNLSPGQAELGVGSESKTSPGSRRTRYDVEVLTKQLGAVSFGDEPKRFPPEEKAYVYASPIPRALPFESSPAVHAPSAIPEPSRRLLRPPVFAPHVVSEHLSHSASAPQLDAYTKPVDVRTEISSQRAHAHNGPWIPGYDNTVGERQRMTTFEPDSRTLERLPERPATYMDVSQRVHSRPLPHQSQSSPPRVPRPFAQPYSPLPLTPSRKPNASFQTPQTPTPRTASGYGKHSRSFLETPESQRSQSIKSPTSGTPTNTIQCAGFTQKGQRCKKRVKAVAAYYSMGHAQPCEDDALDSGSDAALDGGERRFCKLHIGQISNTEGFYRKRTESGVSDREKYIQFSDYVPDDLDEQTKILLRLTMESPLTANESSGYIYAYELRDLATDRVVYYKVGRTDNVPRRLNEWSKQCVSHRPTLRDIFPQRDRGVNDASQHASMSVLPGAMANQGDRCNAVKRLEKLIHIELSARQVLRPPMLPSISHHKSHDPLDFLHTGRPCPDCSTTHREIFAIPRQTAVEGRSEYEAVVRPAILRWQRFVDEIAP